MEAVLALPTARQVVPNDLRYNKVIRYLVQRGYDFGSTSTAAGSSGDVKLLTIYFYYAVRFHFTLDAIQLIRLGAHVCVVNKKDQSALQFAVVNKSHVEPLDIIPNRILYTKMKFYGLESLKFATDARDELRIAQLAASRRQDALHISAALRSQRNVVKMMLYAGAKVNSKDVNGCSPIQCAVYTGDLELVKMLIDAGADINNRNAIGATALHDAVLCCNEKMVHLLLSHGADVSIETVMGRNTALHWAMMLNIGNSHEGVIRKLLKFESDLYKPNKQGNSLFSDIVQYCNVNLVRLCVEKYKAELKKPDHAGHNALVYAAWNVNTNVFDFVLKSAGIEIDLETDYGTSPFASACQASMLKYVKRLISMGADVNAVDERGIAPLIYCIFMPRIARSAKNLPLVLVRDNFEEERRRVIRLLLKCGSDVNQMVYNYSTLGNFILVPNGDLPMRSLLKKLINDQDFEPVRIMIEHVAEVKARWNRQLFNDDNLRLLNENPVTKSYYEKCQAELTAMRTANIGSTRLTYYSALTKPLDLVARYAENEDFVKTFEAGEYQTVYSSFASRLKERFGDAVARRKKIEEASPILSMTLRFADSSHPAFEIILKYLSDADVELLINSAFF